MKIIKRMSLFFFVLFFFSCASGYNLKNKNIKTWKDRRDENVINQQYDFSCGTGSLATLMNYYFNDSVEEKQLIENFLDSLSKDEKEDLTENGFSMFDLKKIAQKRGYEAYIVSATARLLKLNMPILVYLEVREYRHFAIYCGAREDRIFLSDPSRGNIRLSICNFLKEWKGRKALILVKQGFKPSKNNLLSIRVEENFRPEMGIIRDWLIKK